MGILLRVPQYRSNEEKVAPTDAHKHTLRMPTNPTHGRPQTRRTDAHKGLPSSTLLHASLVGIRWETFLLLLLKLRYDIHRSGCSARSMGYVNRIVHKGLPSSTQRATHASKRI